ncbi:PP2C family protein-serine/threonine phosphatase [Nocardia blacklockiae]|uniref:PP2C family protein-serine/threonine phosphatase n=1 Tax=Nocardia blacklockiae TaxID=480036 RepID=UPI002B4B7CE6|nr:protein phosphatase 2C domain-containing protein [Nocardia blacklockiae]
MDSALTTAITRRELIRLTGITGQSVSRRGGRSINADAVAGYTDPATGHTAFVVADGVGDHLLAARAARTAATVVAREAAVHGPQSGILAAQRELLREFPEPSADAVLVVAVLPGDRDAGSCEIAWVGDCRAYRWNGRVLHQITTDHTVAEYLRTRGVEPAARADHMVYTTTRTTRASDIGYAVTGTSTGRLLLSTDGVHKPLSIAEIKQVLASAAGPDVAAETLVDSALRSGGTDNTTALVIDSH